MKQQRAQRPVAINQRFTPQNAVCELCDEPRKVLVRMQKLDKSGSLLSCSGCLKELMGDSGVSEL